MRTTVDLDPDLLRKLRDAAHAEGVPFKTLLNRVLRRGLSEPIGKPARYVCPTFSMGEPRVALDKALALAAEMEDAEVVHELSLRK